ncbi:MAG: anti-sigma factor family protein [Pirellulaceae bacterium]
MNCSEIHELLSGYLDGELSGDVTAKIREHLAGCDTCAQELDGFKRLSQLASGLRTLSPSDGMWDELERKLADTSAASFARAATWMRMSSRSLAIAATLLVAVGLGLLGLRAVHMAQHEAQLAAVIGQYLDTFQESPTDAQRLLETKYQGQAVDVREAVHYMGYTPTTISSLPASYSLDSVYVWKMPCCTCVQSLCKRADGTTVAIFEHDNAQLNWFGRRQTSTADCAGQCCTLVRVDNQLAATWQLGQRHITVVGARDFAEVGNLASAFAGTSEEL